MLTQHLRWRCQHQVSTPPVTAHSAMQGHSRVLTTAPFASANASGGGLLAPVTERARNAWSHLFGREKQQGNRESDSEHWRVHKIDGDGKCMFRATVSCTPISLRPSSLVLECRTVLGVPLKHANWVVVSICMIALLHMTFARAVSPRALPVGANVITCPDETPASNAYVPVQVRSLAWQNGTWLTPQAEQAEADLLRRACHDALCRNRKQSRKYPDARKQVWLCTL